MSTTQTGTKKGNNVFGDVNFNNDALYISSSGNVGIGTTTPSEKLTIQGNISGSGNLNIDGAVTASTAQLTNIVNAGTDTDKFLVLDSLNNVDYRTGAQVLSDIGAQASLTNPITGTGTTNYLPKFTGTSTLGDSLIYDNGTNVGIGTTSPSALLHLKSNFSSGVAVIYDRTQNANIDSLFYTGVSTNGATTSDFMWMGTSTSDMTITGNGNVGIGTTSPGARLDVNGNTIITGSLAVSQSLLQYSNITSVTSGSTSNVASFNTSSYTAAFFDYVTTSGTSARAGTVFTVWNGNNVEYTETSTNDIGSTNNLVLSASLSAGAIRLQATSLSGSWSVKTLARMI